jgi:putative FmdB family regulatory protein
MGADCIRLGNAGGAVKAIAGCANVEQTDESLYSPRMPLYEFHCESCQKDSEVLVRSTRWKGTKCPHCESPKLIKKLSVFAAAQETQEPAPACGGNPNACGRCAPF